MPVTVHPQVLDVLADPVPVTTLAARASRADGSPPLNEESLLGLAAPATAHRRHLLLREPRSDTLVGYATVVRRAPGQVDGELVVDPGARGRGLGRRLALAALDTAATVLPEGGTVGFWAHGDGAAARALATSLGLLPARTLLRLRRPDLPVTRVAPPPGIRLAAFRPGTDEDAWLRVNAAAFAGHPEQGGWTAADLAARETEPGFDPDGILLAWRGERLLGSHWTRRAGAEGEVYVLGVAPDAGVRGLGTALLGAGLKRLRAQGARTVDLYVESDNDRARSLYDRAGFVELSRDTRWTTRLPR